MSIAGNRWSVWAKRLLWASVFAGSLVVSYTGVSVMQQQLRPTAATSDMGRDDAGDEERVNPFASANGTHLIAYVIAASDCGWSSQPGVITAVRAMRAQMASVHGGSYAQVSVVGVALDSDIDAGLRFLSDIGSRTPAGAFDQIIVGGSWLNEQIVRFVWRDGFTEAALPQVLVIERPVNTAPYLLNRTLGVQDDKVVAREIGSRAIVSWLEGGVPISEPVSRAK